MWSIAIFSTCEMGTSFLLVRKRREDGGDVSWLLFLTLAVCFPSKFVAI
jgi:hypothetical protein